MISLEPYSDEFEKEYWTTVKKKITSDDRRDIIISCSKFLPTNFFIHDDVDLNFKSLILTRFEKLSHAYTHITTQTATVMNQECFNLDENLKFIAKGVYKTLDDTYTKVADSKLRYSSMRVRMVNATKLTVCPYCNRDYINNRAPDVSGAQLDHFYSKSDFPIFAICLYNLIPVCGNCNRIKSADNSLFASPFDESIDWDKDLIFSYTGTSRDDIKITLTPKGNMKTNIEKMRIDEAYQIHDTDVMDLIEKQLMYNRTQKQELIDILGADNLTVEDIKKMVFGPEITKEIMRTKPLSKMMYDLHKELDIYGGEK